MSTMQFLDESVEGLNNLSCEEEGNKKTQLLKANFLIEAYGTFYVQCIHLLD